MKEQKRRSLYGQLLELKKWILDLNSMNCEIPVLASYGIYELGPSANAPREEIHTAFGKIHTHLKCYFTGL
jgi:hypothetical protein